MAQGFPGMAFWVEAEVLVEPLQAPAKDWHFLGRNPQRFAGPQPGVHTDSSDFFVVAERNDDEVEGNAPVDRRTPLGLGHERLLSALLEIAHGPEAPAL